MAQHAIRYRPQSQPPYTDYSSFVSKQNNHTSNNNNLSNLLQSRKITSPSASQLSSTKNPYYHATTVSDTNSSITSSLSPNDLCERSPVFRTSESNPNMGNNYSPEHFPFVAKHESFLEEEKDILNRGLENTKQLLLWYEERWETLKKRKDMLNRGLVALDTSVHAQKLNFLRAQITNLNNRIKDLLLSTEFGMPANAVIGNNNLKMKMDKDQIPLIRMPKREVKLSDFQNTNDVRHEGQSQAKTQTKLRRRIPESDYYSNSSGTSSPSSFVTRYTNQIPDTLC